MVFYLPNVELVVIKNVLRRHRDWLVLLIGLGSDYGELFIVKCLNFGHTVMCRVYDIIR